MNDANVVVNDYTTLAQGHVTDNGFQGCAFYRVTTSNKKAKSTNEAKLANRVPDQEVSNEPVKKASEKNGKTYLTNRELKRLVDSVAITLGQNFVEGSNHTAA